MRSWRNWQTHQLEGLAVAIPWWFESTRPHTYFIKLGFIGVLSVFNKIRTRQSGSKWTEWDSRVRLAGLIGNRPSTGITPLYRPLRHPLQSIGLTGAFFERLVIVEPILRIRDGPEANGDFSVLD